MNLLSLIVQYPIDLFDSLLDRLTMYRLVLYTLIAYVLAALGFSLTHKVSFSFFDIVASAVWLVAICRASNWAFANFFKVPRNYESDLVTALILTLILTPAGSIHDFVTLAEAGVAAMLSKYILTINKRHLLNPAAFGAFISSQVFGYYASWWVGFRAMAPVLIVGGILILRKIKRFQMVGVFIALYLAVLLVTFNSGTLSHTITTGLLATPLIFLSTIMLTEPLTSPTKFNQSILYAIVVGMLYSVIKLHISPEEALLIGNILVFAMAPSRSAVFSLMSQRKEADGIYSFLLRSSDKLSFAAGQYIEWTLPGVNVDSRGNRRYLTVSSSPTEKDVMFTVKIPDNPSRFKQRLTALKPGETIVASQLAGSFTLPKSSRTKMVWIAGGVGITPFRSMAKYLLDSGKIRDVRLLYFVNNEQEIAFKTMFRTARSTGIKTSYFVNQRVDKQLLAETIADHKDRTFYISGPQGFVASARKSLLALGVSHSKIVTDFFPGYS